jgi:small subunit ribosomal protein S11
MAASVTPSRRRKQVRQVTSGRVYIQATFNNTIISITDEQGNVIAWGSAGGSGFKGSRKSTPFAAASAVETVTAKAKESGLQKVAVFVKGPGAGRDAAIRAFKSANLEVTSITDLTAQPHNGCRPSKRRRV